LCAAVIKERIPCFAAVRKLRAALLGVQEGQPRRVVGVAVDREGELCTLGNDHRVVQIRCFVQVHFKSECIITVVDRVPDNGIVVQPNSAQQVLFGISEIFAQLEEHDDEPEDAISAEISEDL